MLAQIMTVKSFSISGICARIRDFDYRTYLGDCRGPVVNKEGAPCRNIQEACQ